MYQIIILLRADLEVDETAEYYESLSSDWEQNSLMNIKIT
jgi:hypothetical protein